MIVDLFCGAGGWMAGAPATEHIGYDLDPDAINTYTVAGGRGIRADLSTYSNYRASEGIVGSPPCQPYSKAGKRQGRDAKDGMLPLVCAQWALSTGPRWVALEQVPGAASIFTRVAAMLSSQYHVAMYELHAEQYGVPQTRDRVILMAHREYKPPKPEPKYSRYHRHAPTKIDPGMPEWISMAEALGWGMTERPGMTVTAGGTTSGGLEIFGNGSRQIMDREREAGRWHEADIVGFPRAADDRGEAIWIDGVAFRERDLRPASLPSLVVTGKARSWLRWPHERPSPTIVSEYRPMIVASPGYRVEHPRQNAPGSVEITYTEAAVLQGFDPDWPWQGSRTSIFRQIGNAIPPPLAKAVIDTLEGL